jgi:cytidylate kinase
LRDKKDKTRINSPLVIPKDAHFINNESTFKETTNQINRLLKKL